MILFFVLAGVCVIPHFVFAAQEDEGLSLSMHPPLFQVHLAPGEKWQSIVSVENKGSVMVRVGFLGVDMVLREGGTTYAPIFNDQMGARSLARWIIVRRETVDVDPGTSEKIPFTIIIPSDAQPGAYRAAILAGPSIRQEQNKQEDVSVASAVSSVISLTVSGEVVENALIRELSVDNVVQAEPAAAFTIRIENKGTVQFAPYGALTIYNMWGQERGNVVVEPNDYFFGTMLPGETKGVTIQWKGHKNFFDVGRYTAHAHIVYGSDDAAVSEKISFWVVPVRSMAVVAGILLLFLLFTNMVVDSVVRNMFKKEMIRLQPASSKKSERIIFTIVRCVYIIPSRIRARFRALPLNERQKKALKFIFIAVYFVIFIVFCISVFSSTAEFSIKVKSAGQ